MTKDSEFNYYRFFRKWLRLKGYQRTFQSVDIWLNQEVDVVGVKTFKTVHPHVATIEVKLNDWSSGLIQAFRRLHFADYSYLGVVYKDVGDLAYFFYKFGKSFSTLENPKYPYRIGVLIYDVVRERMIEVLKARRNINVASTSKSNFLYDCLGLEENEKIKPHPQKPLITF